MILRKMQNNLTENCQGESPPIVFLPKFMSHIPSFVCLGLL